MSIRFRAVWMPGDVKPAESAWPGGTQGRRAMLTLVRPMPIDIGAASPFEAD